jgi:hypothetical protein
MAQPGQKRVNYLNNKDILAEIHKSKNTFCSYKDKITDSDFDLILEPDENGKTGLEKINVRTLKEARDNRATRLSKLTGETVDPKSITNEDIVIRVMTDEHIPLGPKKRTKASTKPKKKKAADLLDDLDLDEDTDDMDVDVNDPDVEMVPVRCNFPPFKHYRIDAEGNPFEVGRSHWKGTIEDGHFSKSHGRVTDKLAMMYMKLCERYATRSNWRGYTYNDEMRSQALLQLCQIGLQFNEAKSQNPFAYYTAAVTNSFTRVLNIEKKMQNIRDDILEQHGLDPSWTRQFANENIDGKYLED